MSVRIYTNTRIPSRKHAAVMKSYLAGLSDKTRFSTLAPVRFTIGQLLCQLQFSLRIFGASKIAIGLP